MVAVATIVLASVASAQVSSHQTTPAGKQAQGSAPKGAHMGGASSRQVFAAECGIRDANLQRAMYLSRGQNGVWKKVSPEAPAGDKDTALARVWHEQAWVVALHESNAAGDAMHTADMCFRPDGSISKIVDKYIDVPKCNCMRVTETTFDASGKLTAKQQVYASPQAGQKLSQAPAAAAGFPKVYEFKRVDQLPFAGMLRSTGSARR